MPVPARTFERFDHKETHHIGRLIVKLNTINCPAERIQLKLSPTKCALLIIHLVALNGKAFEMEDRPRGADPSDVHTNSETVVRGPGFLQS